MANAAQDAVEAWRKAAKLARIAETKLGDAWDAHTHDSGPPVPPELLQQVAELRARENDLLTVAMTALRG